MRFCKFVRVLLKLQSLGFRSPFGRASYLSLLMQTKVTQRKPPRRRALRAPATAPALHYLRHPCRRLPSESARALRGSLNAYPRAYSELARIVRASLRPFLRTLAAPQGLR